MLCWRICSNTLYTSMFSWKYCAGRITSRRLNSQRSVLLSDPELDNCFFMAMEDNVDMRFNERVATQQNLEIFKRVLDKVSDSILAVSDAGSIQEILRKDYEQQRQVLVDLRTRLEYEQKLLEDREKETKEQLQEVRNQEELEPERDANAVETRKLLEEAGIRALPFYKTVEFSDKLDEAACARLEAQLQKMGILDALVVSEKNFAAIGKIYP